MRHNRTHKNTLRGLSRLLYRGGECSSTNILRTFRTRVLFSARNFSLLFNFTCTNSKLTKEQNSKLILQTSKSKLITWLRFEYYYNNPNINTDLHCFCFVILFLNFSLFLFYSVSNVYCYCTITICTNTTHH